MKLVFNTCSNGQVLLLTNSGGSPTLQFHVSINESVSSGGRKLILTSNGVILSRWWNNTDGSNTQVLQTNGSGVLTFVDGGSNVMISISIKSEIRRKCSFSGSDDRK